MTIPSDVRKYSDKIPKSIRTSMRAFTGSECALVDRHFASGSRSQQGNCFINVAKQVKKHGGRSIYGWMLNRHSGLQSNGIWSWQFHAVWETPWQTWMDISKYYLYDDYNQKFTIFWGDKSRRADLIEGTAYNSVVAFEKLPPPHYYETFSIQFKVGQLYWTAGDITNLRKLSQHSGIYRFLTKDYKKNIELLERKYGLKKDGRKLVSVTGASMIPTDVLFDFTIS